VDNRAEESGDLINLMAILDTLPTQRPKIPESYVLFAWSGVLMLVDAKSIKQGSKSVGQQNGWSGEFGSAVTVEVQQV
jgi:hypothetical protein